MFPAGPEPPSIMSLHVTASEPGLLNTLTSVHVRAAAHSEAHSRLDLTVYSVICDPVPVIRVSLMLQWEVCHDGSTGAEKYYSLSGKGTGQA